MSAFREAPNPDGTKGPVSMRRVLAFFYALVSTALGVAALPHAASGWWVFIPSGLAALLSVLLLLFTTWNDLAVLAGAVKK